MGLFLSPYACPVQKGAVLNNLDHGHPVVEAKEMMKGFERQVCEERGKVTVGRDLEGREKGGRVERPGAGLASPSQPRLPTWVSETALLSFPLAPAENIILSYVSVIFNWMDAYRCMYTHIHILTQVPTCLFSYTYQIDTCPQTGLCWIQPLKFSALREPALLGWHIDSRIRASPPFGGCLYQTFLRAEKNHSLLDHFSTSLFTLHLTLTFPHAAVISWVSPVSQARCWVLWIEPHKLERGSKEVPPQRSEEFPQPVQIAGFLWGPRESLVMKMLRVIGIPELIFLPYTSVVCITELTSVLAAERKQKVPVLSTFMDHTKDVRSEQSGCEYMRTQEHPGPIVNGAVRLKRTLFYFCFLLFPFL